MACQQPPLLEHLLPVLKLPLRGKLSAREQAAAKPPDRLGQKAMHGVGRGDMRRKAHRSHWKRGGRFKLCISAIWGGEERAHLISQVLLDAEKGERAGAAPQAAISV